jgi:hypothetical protein
VSLLSAIQPVAINRLVSFLRLERSLLTHNTPPNDMRCHDECGLAQTMKLESKGVEIEQTPTSSNVVFI